MDPNETQAVAFCRRCDVFDVLDDADPSAFDAWLAAHDCDASLESGVVLAWSVGDEGDDAASSSAGR